MFTQQLTPFEQRSILAQSSDDRRYTMFFMYWSLKEAFIKAIGQGLGYDLQQVALSSS
jgi:4'-phosphopantetheinyl transferase